MGYGRYLSCTAKWRRTPTNQHVIAYAHQGLALSGFIASADGRRGMPIATRPLVAAARNYDEL